MSSSRPSKRRKTHSSRRSSQDEDEDVDMRDEDMEEVIEPSQSSSSSSSSSKRRKKRFIFGQIVRIKLHNFVTYDDVEFYTEAGLNLLVGPNGSGKSSIVCAICIGLGGSTKSLGRAEKVQDYVKRGERNSFVEIELRGNPNCVIRREFDVMNNSRFLLDNRRVAEKVIKERTGALNIKVDNLCQFLAQERVVNFARLSPEDLLLETEKATESAQLHTHHMKLIDLRNREKEATADNVNLSERLDVLQRQQEDEKRNQIRYEERERLAEEIKELEVLRPWYIASDFYTKVEDAKADYVEADQTLKETKRQDQPTRDKLKKAAKAYENAKKDDGKNIVAFKGLDDERMDLMARCDAMDEEVIAKRSEVQSLHLAKADRERQLRLAEAKVVQLEGEEKKCRSSEEIDRDQEEVSAKINELRQQKRELHDRQEDKEREKEEAERNQRHRCQLLTQLLDADRRRIAKLFPRDNQGARAMYDWVEAHRGEFKSPVYGPILKEIDFETENIAPQNRVEPRLVAKYVENNLAYHQKFGYVATCKEDWFKLHRKTKDFRQRVTVIDMDLNGNRNEGVHRSGNMQHLRQHGVKGWLDEYIKVPEVVRLMLQRNTGLCSMAITAQELHPNQLDQVLCKNAGDRNGCSNLGTPSNRHRVTISSYGNRSRSVLVHGLSDSKFMTQGIDEEQKKSMQAELEKANAAVVEIIDAIKLLKAEERPITHEIDALQVRRRQLNGEKRANKSVRQRLKDARRRLENARGGENFDEKEASLHAEIKRLNASRVEIVRLLKTKFEKWIQAAWQRDEIVLNRERARVMYKYYERMVRDLDARYAHLEAALQQAKERFIRVKREAKNARNAARQSVSEEIYQERRAKYTSGDYEADDRQINTSDRLESVIHEKTVRVQGMVVDPGAYRRYQEREKEITDLTAKVNQSNDLKASRRAEIEKYKALWLPTLKQMVEKISLVYQESFKKIGCRSEIVLVENEDFEKFALEIRVSFRKDLELKPLSGTSQSGGERSVSTMLYLLCLQAVTTCPFRVVDEINQGMDPKNERMIFSQVVASAALENSPQYFLVTPKLLPGLNYSNVNVLLVYNGPGQIAQEEWDTSTQLDFASQRQWD